MSDDGADARRVKEHEAPTAEPPPDKRCGATQCGLVCDRERGHTGMHRGYVVEHDDVLFWQADGKPDVSHSADARRVAPLDPLLKRLQESRDECLRDAQAHLDEASNRRRFGHDDGLVRTLAQVHHYFAKRFAELLGEAQRIPAPPDAQK